MRPIITLSGQSVTQERYTYGQHLQYNGTAAYGGPGSIVGYIMDAPPLVVVAVNLGTQVTYNDPTFTYSTGDLSYNGYSMIQGEPQLMSIDLPQIIVNVEN